MSTWVGTVAVAAFNREKTLHEIAFAQKLWSLENQEDQVQTTENKYHWGLSECQGIIITNKWILHDYLLTLRLFSSLTEKKRLGRFRLRETVTGWSKWSDSTMESYVLWEAVAVKAMKGDLMIALRLPNLSNDGRKSTPLKVHMHYYKWHAQNTKIHYILYQSVMQWASSIATSTRFLLTNGKERMVFKDDDNATSGDMKTTITSNQ